MENSLASAIIWSIPALAVVLGILVTVHEFGHFAMAKLLKIRVLTFSLGFGPRLIGFKRGGTDYRLSYFPLGGYVKMAGEVLEEERKGDPDEFLSHSKWHRFLVAVAGPLMNILLAVSIWTSFNIIGGYVPVFSKESAPIVGPVTADPAKRAGLQTGDKILSVQNNSVTTWEELEIALQTAPDDALNIEVERNNRPIQLHFDAPATEHEGPSFYGFRYTLSRTLVSAVNENTPAQRAGLKAGDEILSVSGNGRTGTNFDQILNLISDSKGIPLDFEILRPDKEPIKENLLQSFESQSGKTIHHLTIAPFEDERKLVITGFNLYEPLKFIQYRPIDAFTHSIQSSYKQSALLFRIIGRIIKRSASVRKSLSGPIEIAKMSGRVARTRNLHNFLEWLAFISLQLGIINLLPIPIMDGGVIVLLIIEGLLRKELTLRLKEKIIQAGFVFIVLLMAIIIFNDITKNINFSHLFHH
jgi:regulator of sigma E protease